MGAADWEQQSSASATPVEACRNHERAESRTMFIKKKACQDFVLDDTNKPMIGSLEKHGPDAASLDPLAQQP